jgi:hypothetical protein
VAGLSAYQLLWIGSGSIVVVGWLICAFATPSPRRVIVEWLSVTAMYVGLLTLFISLTMKAQASGNTFALVAFGFLSVMFGGGMLVSLWHTLVALGGEKRAAASATN